MTIRNLDALFTPKSVAVVGASTRQGSVGAVVMHNLLQGGFSGPIMPVNPRYRSVAGVLAYADVDSLPMAPDLAVICSPPETVPGAVEALGRLGARAAAILTAGLAQSTTKDGRSLQQAVLDAARPYRLRVLGPNSIGLLVPRIGLNASFAHADVPKGRLAFVSQSGALCTAVMDYARSHGIGFSHFLSMGEMSDVDFGDVLDYLGGDSGTQAILLYIESFRHPRKFMSAARAAARNKPVLAIKSGRVAEGARAARSHTGALAGVDEVYDAALRRAGILRVFDIDELFDAVETLARLRPFTGDRLAVLSNGGGPAVMATDKLITTEGRLAELAPETLERLDAVLPTGWSGANPVDILGDATDERYAQALAIMLKDKQNDAVLVMHAPTAVADSVKVAEAVIEAQRGTRRNILTSWLGADSVAEARTLLAKAGLPTFETPDHAVRGFMHMVRFRRNREMLMETPASVPEEFTPDTEAARRIIAAAREAGRTALTETETMQVLAAYGVATVTTRVAADAAEAAKVAGEIGFPVALKILSRDIRNKSDVGGVALYLNAPAEVRRAVAAMTERVARVSPIARIEGFTVQPMARRPGAWELFVGVTTDSLFGPVILFGQGGSEMAATEDRAVGLPPLNMVLAREMMSRTRIYRLLAGQGERASVDLDALSATLIKIAQMVVDLPELRDLDINPLLADDRGVLALDASMALVGPYDARDRRLAIRPYPRELEETVTLRDGTELVVRPIRPEDEPAHQDFVSHLTMEDIRYRFFGIVRRISHSEMARFTQIDYDREMAFVAQCRRADGEPETLGVVRVVFDPDNVEAEFAIVVRSDFKGRGLGPVLMNKVIDYCRRRGTPRITGQVLRENRPMRRLMEQFGFRMRDVPGDDCIEVFLDLEEKT